MERYSAFRDSGTGIQPFLTPVPPARPTTWERLLSPIRYVYGALRTLIALILGIVYIVLQGICLILVPISFVHRAVTWFFTAIIARLVLLLAGCLWISVEVVSSRRRRHSKQLDQWSPGAGDIIVSNWVSWIEILWLAFRFDPIFAFPIVQPLPQSLSAPPPDNPVPGRSTGTGSAALSSPTRTPAARGAILGFQRMSWLAALRRTGHVPLYESARVVRQSSLEEIRRTATRPIVIFPECTTSNGRGILRFSDAFHGEKVPVRAFGIFLMCVRYDPPTTSTCTPSHSIPSPSYNPLPHFFMMASNLVPPKITIRLLAPSSSPSCPHFVTSEAIPGYTDSDALTEVCAVLIAQVGKLKRLRIGWEDKVAFLRMHREKRKV